LYDIKWLSLGLSLLELLFIIRAIIRPHRSPASRVAWVVVIGAIPVVGLITYLLFGETNIGYRRWRRVVRVQQRLEPLKIATEQWKQLLDAIPPQYRNPFLLGESISGLPLLAGNQGDFYSDSNEMFTQIVHDIDNAQEHVHVLFYIWLLDENGNKVIDALIRAVNRGVSCRMIVDGMGSRDLIRSERWEEMRTAGVLTAVALPIGNLFLRMLLGRIDLRNHRKMVVIDDEITYCGSHNCADPEFRIKAAYAPWVDVGIRFTGPIVRQKQHLFVSDWMSWFDEDITSLLKRPLPEGADGFIAQAFGTGPTVRNAAMPEMFVSLMHAAQNELIITSPYYVPDESMQNALRAAAHRGVDTTLILPAKSDSSIVAAASESYYPELLQAGVKVYEYPKGLLHAKTFTVDRCLSLIGSANLDRRSFELNYENNILFYDTELTEQIVSTQLQYRKDSDQVTDEYIDSWSIGQRLWRNSIAMMGPLL